LNFKQAYAYLPVAWSTGGTLAPIIGGSLSHPAERFPTLFGNSEFLKQYPYFLPCSVPAAVSAIAFLVAYFFLKETVSSTLPISQLFSFRKSKASRNVVGSQTSVTPISSPNGQKADINDEKPLPLRSLFTHRVAIAAANYALLSLVDIALRALQPLFFSTPIHLGGLGLPPSMIGSLLSIYGVLNGVFQVLFFARILDKWGAKRVFMAGILSAFPMFASFPILSYLVQTQGLSTTVWIIVGLQLTLSIFINLSYGKQVSVRQ
jgi:MFS family permease